MSEYDPNYLDFEQPILELEAKIKKIHDDPEKTAKSDKTLDKLQIERDNLISKIFNNLSDWQISQVARHPLRPHTLDYIPNIFDNFTELHGDRMFGDDSAIVTGLATIDNYKFILIGHQKGRDAKEKVKRNFGMSKPEGYRKALRVMRLAEKFNLPILTFIDTPGAYPGIDAESRNQSQAIAENLYVMSNLKVPIISVVIGEGGSGGAIAMASANTLIMLEHSIYSVISPEGCASILWKNSDKMREAADALKLTAQHLKEIGVVDRVVKEPLGGAHRDKKKSIEEVKKVLIEEIKAFKKIDRQKIKKLRSEKYINMGSLSNL